MPSPRVLIADLPEQPAPVDTDLLVVQNGVTTKKMTVGRLSTQTATAIADHLADTTGAHAATAISATPNVAPLIGTDVQTQLAQTASAINSLVVGGGAQLNLDAHIADATDAHDASAISLVPGAAPFDQADVQAWANYMSTSVATTASLDAHLLNGTDAHDASAISAVANPAPMTGTNVQTQLNQAAGTVTNFALAFPVGGTTRQALTKNSNVDYDTEWFDVPPIRRTVLGFSGAEYGLHPDHENQFVTLSNATAMVVSVPNNTTLAFPIGGEVDTVWYGVGQPTIVPAGGVTVLATPGLKYRARYSAVTLKKIGTNEWVAIGDLSA